MHRLNVIFHVLAIWLGSMCTPDLSEVCNEMAACSPIELRDLELCVQVQREAFAAMSSAEKYKFKEEFRDCKQFEACEFSQCIGVYAGDDSSE